MSVQKLSIATSMSLEDAVAALEQLLAEPPDAVPWDKYREFRAVSWPKKAAEIREAVKAVAMAAVREVDVAIHTDWTEMRVSRIFREAMAELERLLEVKHD